MLTAFFDESGHFATSGFFSVASFVAQKTEWPVFSDNWRTALHESGAPYLHMREFAHSVGPYASWTERQRRGLMSGCLAAINATRAVAVGAVLQVDDFNVLSDECRSRMQNPFFCCLQEVVRGAAINGVFEDPSAKVDMVFSVQDEFHGKAVLLHEAMTRMSDVKKRIGTLSFMDMRDHPELQAADLLAYELRHHYQLGTNRPPPPTRWPFRQIVEHQRNVLGARMLKFIPGWELRAQAESCYDQVMAAVLSDPEVLLAHAFDCMPHLR